MSLFIAVIASLALSSTPAKAGDTLGRDLDGQPLELGVRPTALVFWRLGDEPRLPEVIALQRACLDVVLVNEDAPSERSMLRPAVRRAGVQARIIADPGGGLRAPRGGADGPSVIVYDADGLEIAQASLDQTASLAFLSRVSACPATAPADQMAYDGAVSHEE